MFYTYGEKLQNSFFGDWRTRTVAFDTRRRYLYYSEPVTPAAASTPAPEAHTSSSHSSPSLRPVTAAATSSGTRGTELPVPSPRNGTNTPLANTDSHTPRTTEAEMAKVVKVEWRKKLKVFGVVPVATVKEFKLGDTNLHERDLYQLEITGELRPMATGETPPVGPLLCPSAGLTEMPWRCNLANEEFIGDPFFLKELFNAMRDQFEELQQEKLDAEAAAVASGRASTVPPSTTLTITSPRTGKEPPARKEKVLLRCRDEREFRRLWYVLQTVLGFDKLITRPYRGLPPYDPRNMVSFGHIPMTVWHTFKALDKAVFYMFTRGDVMGIANAQHETAVNLHGCYMCVTHDMVYFMRDTGNIPRWIRLQEVSEFHYNVTAKKPFFVFLSDPPAPDLIFVPLPPVFGAKAIADYDPIFDVRRMQRVMHDTVFASLAIRRVVKLNEVKDASVQAYVHRMQQGPRPLRLHPGAMYNSTMSCPLPKEQLAAVWYDVQQKLRAIGDVTERAAIPLYEANAPDLQLSSAQLASIEQQLDDERYRLDDVVGMPLERARQLPEANNTPGHSSSSRGHRRQHPTGNATTTAGPSQTSSQRESSAREGAPVEDVRVLPLTAEMLHTPQLAGTYHRQQRSAPRAAADGPGRGGGEGDDAEDSASTVSHEPSEFSSYLVPGTRYITREELEANHTGPNKLGTPELDAIGRDNHQEVERGSTVRGGARPSSPLGGGVTHRGAHSTGGFRYGPERTVNEIVSESLAALEKKRAEGSS